MNAIFLKCGRLYEYVGGWVRVWALLLLRSAFLEYSKLVCKFSYA
jgi:hypothetical protein